MEETVKNTTPDKKKKRKAVYVFIEILCLTVFVVSSLFIANYFWDNHTDDQRSKELEKTAGDDDDDYNTEVVIDPPSSSGQEEPGDETDYELTFVPGGEEAGVPEEIYLSATDVSVGIDHDFALFSDLLLDDEPLVRNTDYVLDATRRVVVLKAASFADLEDESEHPLSALFTDGRAEGTLTYFAAPVSSGENEEPAPKEPFVLKFLAGKNISKLVKTYNNDDICAWIKFTGYADTLGKMWDVSQAVVLGDDNAFYLTHDATGAEHTNGAVYFDYKTNVTSLQKNRNIVIYAHAKSYNKFGALKGLNKSKEWMNDERYQYIYLQTATETTIWQVFSWYNTTADDPYRTRSFKDDDEFMAFIKTIQSKNKIKTLKPYTFSPDDVLLTLSTCKSYDPNKRVAVHAVLVAYTKLEDIKK